MIPTFFSSRILDHILFYGILGVYAVVIGALVAGALVIIAMSIEFADDIKHNGWS